MTDTKTRTNPLAAQAIAAADQLTKGLGLNADQLARTGAAYNRVNVEPDTMGGFLTDYSRLVDQLRDNIKECTVSKNDFVKAIDMLAQLNMLERLMYDEKGQPRAMARRIPVVEELVATRRQHRLRKQIGNIPVLVDKMYMIMEENYTQAKSLDTFMDGLETTRAHNTQEYVVQMDEVQARILAGIRQRDATEVEVKTLKALYETALQKCVDAGIRVAEIGRSVTQEPLELAVQKAQLGGKNLAEITTEQVELMQVYESAKQAYIDADRTYKKEVTELAGAASELIAIRQNLSLHDTVFNVAIELASRSIDLLCLTYKIELEYNQSSTRLAADIAGTQAYGYRLWKAHRDFRTTSNNLLKFIADYLGTTDKEMQEASRNSQWNDETIQQLKDTEQRLLSQWDDYYEQMMNSYRAVIQVQEELTQTKGMDVPTLNAGAR